MPHSLTSTFVDRVLESQTLTEAILQRESLMISGAAGIGKTALVANVLKNLPPRLAASTLYLTGADGLQPFLRTLLRRLYEMEDPTLRRQLRQEGVVKTTFDSWLRTLPASRLRGTLYRSMEAGRYWVFLDHLPRLTRALAKVVKEVVRMRNTPVYLLARGSTATEVGPVNGLFWSKRQHLNLGPLPEKAARELLESCIERFRLARLNLESFREESLQLSGKIPGALIKMCALAAQPRYQSGSRIKTNLIHIDSLVNGYSTLNPAPS